MFKLGDIIHNAQCTYLGILTQIVKGTYGGTEYWGLWDTNPQYELFTFYPTLRCTSFRNRDLTSSENSDKVKE